MFRLSTVKVEYLLNLVLKLCFYHHHSRRRRRRRRRRRHYSRIL